MEWPTLQLISSIYSREFFCLLHVRVCEWVENGYDLNMVSGLKMSDQIYVIFCRHHDFMNSNRNHSLLRRVFVDFNGVLSNLKSQNSHTHRIENHSKANAVLMKICAGKTLNVCLLWSDLKSGIFNYTTNFTDSLTLLFAILLSFFATVFVMSSTIAFQRAWGREKRKNKRSQY